MPARGGGSARRPRSRPTTPPSTASTTSARSSSRVDFFPPLVDDPALFGRIAATNALNDVFAMGGTPLLALSIAAFPEELRDGGRRGGLRRRRRAGARGGRRPRRRPHDPRRRAEVRARGRRHRPPGRGLGQERRARPGDALFLTKPLGTGLVLAAQGRHRRGGALDDDAQRRAADALRRFSPNAVTDVTGFGLFGHAHEMAERSGVRLVLDSASLPALDGALEAARARDRAPAATRATASSRRSRPTGVAGGAARARLRRADGRRAARLAPGGQGALARSGVPCA